MRESLIRASSIRIAISCRRRLISAFSRILALMLLAATLRANVTEKWANEIAWITLDRMRLGQPRGRRMLSARSETSINARIRLKAEISRLRQEIAILIEEARIKDSRMDRIPAQRRPHYPSIERMAILELRAARGWSLSRTARRFLVTPATIASWMQRLDDEGPDALVQVREPVNRFPDFVRYIVCRLKVLCPTMGKVKIAQILRRVGLHLSSTTVGRMLKEPLRPRPEAEVEASGRVIRKARATPKYLITDHGKQFISAGFGKWCRRKGIHQRFGAIGKYGSLAVVERLIRSIKDECTRRLIIPYRRDAFRRELTLFVEWFNGYRPHTWLQVRTPDEIYFGRPPACLAPRFEPRARWPRRSRCAAPQARVRGRCGVRLELHVSFRVDRKHLPVVELRRAA